MGCGLSYLGEETKDRAWLERQLSTQILDAIHDQDQFFGKTEGVIRVIFDGIDGTENFTRGLPLFCTAAAILVEDELQVSAIYDPIHHYVYSAQLAGPRGKPGAVASASSWDISAGNRIDLIALASGRKKKRLAKEAVAFHLTRSNQPKLKEFLRPEPGRADSKLERLSGKTSVIAAKGHLHRGIRAALTG